MTVDKIELGEVCDFTYGEGLKEENRINGRIPVYGSNGRVGWHNQAITSGPTIVIGRKGSIGEINWSEGPCFPIDTTYYVEKTKKLCDLRWLYYALLKLDLTRLNKSAAVPGLNRDDAYEKLILFPDVPAQKRIAQYLDQTDRLCRQRRYALEMSAFFLPAVFIEMFGDLRKNPNQYEVATLGDICDVRDGTHDSPKYQLNGYPLITSKNLVSGYVDLKGAELISKEDYDKANKRSKVHQGDILMPMIGTIGNPVIVDHEPEYAIKNVALIKFIDGSPSRIYIQQLLSSSYFDFITSRNSRGGTQKFIALGDIRDFPIPIPPVPLQREFEDIVKKYNRVKSAHSESLRQAEHLFQSLLHQAFSEN